MTRCPGGWGRRSLLLVAGAAMLCSLTACAGHDDASSSGGHGTDHTLAASGGRTDHTAHPADVRVGLTEWTILTSAEQVPAGRLTLRVTNTGATEHDLVITGTSGRWHSAHLPPGGRTHLTVRAVPGERLTLLCSLPGHEAHGMRTTLQVAG